MQRIKLAAIKRKSDGIVFTGRDHEQIFLSRPKDELSGSEMGFITNRNRFVGREEAANIAFFAEQIKKPATQLFSEDITGNWPWAKEIIAKLQNEKETLERMLNKAEVVLWVWNPKDMWFPQIEQQFSELMDEIHNILKKHTKSDVIKQTTDDVKHFELVAVQDGAGESATIGLYVEYDDEVVVDLKWPSDWPKWVGTKFLKEHGFKVVIA